MAPEQLAGKDVSIRSDIYALGLVLYEVYTGRPAYEGATLDEIRRSRSSAPTSPSSHVHELDPAVERVILRCLEREPSDRPGSAIAVAAALPGGDPLADALAAGETPDPQLLAEAGAAGGLTPRVAIACVIATVTLMAFLIVSAERFTLTSRTGLAKAPAVLAGKAGEILAAIGYDEPPGDSLFAFEINRPYFEHLKSSGDRQRRWDAVLTPQPPAILFGYRQDPATIVFESSGSIGDWINRSPPTNPGAVAMRLDAEGRLVRLDVVPPEHEASGDEPSREPDWDKLLVAAGFDPQALAQAEPEWLPRNSSDHRRAWEGVYPDAPDVDIRIEAASYAGRPVSFRIIEPWTQPREAPPPPTGWMARAGAWISTGWYLTVLIVSGFVAWRNVRLGRGDNRTAIRFAVFLAALRFIWFIGAHHVSTGEEIGILQAHLSYSAQRFVLAYVFYLAFEPYARKLWPHMLTSWVRLFDRRFRDPLVGRDLLVGVVFGTTFTFVQQLAAWASVVFGLQGVDPGTANWTLEGLRGFRHSITAIAGVQTSTLLEMFIPLMMVLILRLVLRRTWIAVVLMSLMFMAMVIPEVGNAAFAIPVIVCGFAIWWFFLFRFGLLTLAVGYTLSNMLNELSLTLNLTAWWSATTWLVLALFAGITAWGFWASLAGRPVFKDEILGAG